MSKPAAASTETACEHHAQLYEDDGFLANSVGGLMGDALLAGEAAVVIATAERRRALEALWAMRGVDATGARARGQYVPLDAAETLERFTVGGSLDQERFVEVVGGAIKAANDRYPAVRAFGEMVALLWAAGNREAAVRLEDMWNDLAQTHAFSLLCAYPMRLFAGEAMRSDFLRVCDRHDDIMPAESYSALPRRTDRLRAVCELQQTASAVGGIVLERDEFAARLADRLKEQVEANRRKDEFLAMLGHELRNPLSAARNAVIHARLSDGPKHRALDIAHRQLDHLTRLVDDLLDVARITEGKIRLRRTKVSLRDVVSSAIENTRQLIEEHGHTICISLAADPMPLEVDAVRIEQVIVNFLSNAAKYTPPGGRIEVGAERHDDWAELRVRDNGLGISPDVLPHVFELFTQGKRELHRSEGGLGIGLTLARRLVELHGGTVAASSAGAGCGAEFVMRLPLRAAASEHVVPGQDPGPMGTGTAAALRVLIVEDNVDVADSLCLLLEHCGHEVRVVHDGEEAVAALIDRAFDVALLDIGLPGLDGYEVAARLRSLPNGAKTVLIALTGYGQPEDKRRAEAAGFEHHFLKPVSLEALETVFSRVQPGDDPDVRGTIH